MPTSHSSRTTSFCGSSAERWLWQPALRALRVATVLSLSACGGEPSDSEPSAVAPMTSGAIAGAGELSAPAPEPLGMLSVCLDGQPRKLVPGMTLTRAVDYVADVGDGAVYSEQGDPCGGASDRAECNNALWTARGGRRHLETSEGDVVRNWLSTSPSALLGEIDRLEEALWIAEARSTPVGCNASATRDAEGYLFDPAIRTRVAPCQEIEEWIVLRVRPDGSSDALGLSAVQPVPEPPRHCGPTPAPSL